MVGEYAGLCREFPIYSIEDGLGRRRLGWMGGPHG